jgi:hypothetical protein
VGQRARVKWQVNCVPSTESTGLDGLKIWAISGAISRDEKKNNDNKKKSPENLSAADCVAAGTPTRTRLDYNSIKVHSRSGGEFGDLSFISSSSNFLDAVGAGNFRSMNPESKGSADILGLFYFYYFSSVA